MTVFAPFTVRTSRSANGEWLYAPWRETTGPERLRGLVIEASLLPERSFRTPEQTHTGFHRSIERVIAIAMVISQEHPDLWAAARDSILEQFPFLAPFVAAPCEALA